MFPAFLPLTVPCLRMEDAHLIAQRPGAREWIILGHGYAVAVYAAQVPGSGPRRFVAYAKVCREQPACYWEAVAFAKFSSDTEHPGAAAAMADALDAAVMSLANLGLIDARSRAPRCRAATARQPVGSPELAAA